MAYLDKFRAFVQGLIDECQEVEKVNELNGILTETEREEKALDNLLKRKYDIPKNQV